MRGFVLEAPWSGAWRAGDWQRTPAAWCPVSHAGTLPSLVSDCGSEGDAAVASWRPQEVLWSCGHGHPIPHPPGLGCLPVRLSPAPPGWGSASAAEPGPFRGGRVGGCQEDLPGDPMAMRGFGGLLEVRVSSRNIGPQGEQGSAGPSSPCHRGHYGRGWVGSSVGPATLGGCPGVEHQ